MLWFLETTSHHQMSSPTGCLFSDVPDSIPFLTLLLLFSCIHPPYHQQYYLLYPHSPTASTSRCTSDKIQLSSSYYSNHSKCPRSHIYDVVHAPQPLKYPSQFTASYQPSYAGTPQILSCTNPLSLRSLSVEYDPNQQTTSRSLMYHWHKPI
jgi:hypothetical protein